MAVTEAINLPAVRDCCSTSHQSILSKCVLLTVLPCFLPQAAYLDMQAPMSATRTTDPALGCIMSVQIERSRPLLQCHHNTLSLHCVTFAKRLNCTWHGVNINIQNQTRAGVVYNTYTHDSIFHVHCMKLQDTIVQWCASADDSESWSGLKRWCMSIWGT